jgi:hypothetical protein
MPASSRRSCNFVLAAMAFALAFGASAPVQAASKAPRVLLMHATDLLTPSTIEQDAITRKAISEAWPAPVEFYSVGFDEIRSLGPSIESDLLDVLLKQYSERAPDLIVFHGLMHDFYSRYRDRLWPGVPVMFAGVAAHRLGDPPFSTGMPTSSITFDLPGTVDLALQLQPEAKHLLLIVGTSAYDQLWQELAPRQLAGYRERLTIELSAGKSLGELNRLVAGLKSDTIVVFLSMYRDGLE